MYKKKKFDCIFLFQLEFSTWLSNNILSSHLLQQNIEKKEEKKLLEGRIVLSQEYPYMCLRKEGRKEEENEGGWDLEERRWQEENLLSQKP